jgi:hypothetical protein
VEPGPDLTGEVETVTEKVAVFYDGECVLGECDNHTVAVVIQDINFGFIYVPIYKNCSFSADVTSNFSFSRKINSNGEFLLRSSFCKFTQSHKGELTVKGICSVRTARELIVDAIAERAYDEVYAKIHELQNGSND